MAFKKTLTPGAIELEQGTLNQTKEDIRLDQIIPSEILENKDKLDKFLKAYYTFMNMDEFIYQETKVFSDVVLNGLAQFRIADPNNENNKFFTDETGASSTLVLTAPNGSTQNIALTDINVAITNGNELPGTLVTSTSEIGKTFTVNGLAAYNNYTAQLTTIQKNWVGPGPSYVMNTIETAMDIDTNSEGYLELMQKEIAATIPRGVTVDKRTLYKQIIDFYRLRGSSDSIEIFFKILFNDIAEVTFPYDKVLVPSSGNWDVNASLPKGGQYLDNKGFLSDSIVVQDSKKYQKFSYLIKTGKNLSDWELSYDRLVHPAGFIYFAEILIFLQLTKAVLGEDVFNANGYVDLAPNGEPSGRSRTDDLGLAIRKVLSAIPERQPGIIGPEDVPLLVEMFVSTFLPNITAKVHKTGTVSVDLKSGIINGTTITSGGSGYTAVPVITSTDTGTPSGFTTAALTAVLTNGSVSSITIGNGGKDYNTPSLSIAAPTAMTFNPATAVNLLNDTITLTSAQAAALNNGDVVTYDSGGGGSIANLTSPQAYRVVNKSGNTIQLEVSVGSGAIDLGSVGSGTSHTLTGATATATATTLDGALEALTIGEPGFGYTGSSLSITFNGISLPGLTGVNPSVTVGLDSLGRLDKDDITINSEGRNWQNLVGTVPANPNATSIASIDVVGLADKNFLVAPTITFPIPQSKDATGAFLSSNVTATAIFTIASADILYTSSEQTADEALAEGLRVGAIEGKVKIFKGEITGTTITNAGSGYINDPVLKIGSQANNEVRVADQQEIIEVNCNHNHVDTLITEVKTNPVQATGSIMTSTGTAVKFLPESRVKIVNSNFRTVINNNYKQRKGTENFFTSPRLYNTNQTIEFLGSKTLQTINSSDINNNNTSTFVHIE